VAVLYITEYSTMAQVPNAAPQMPQEPPIAEQTVAIGGASVQSNALNVATKFVRLHTDAICSIEFGTNPTASATTGRMAANQTEYRGVPQLAAPLKVAVITNS
jgi:hypothetical protein